MPTPVFTPRINNNDDTVRLAMLLAEPGTFVKAGDPIVEIETDKATFTVEAPAAGYLLAILGKPDDTIEVGSTLAWLGEKNDDQIPAAASESQPSPAPGVGAEPTMKALLLLRAYGLQAAEVPASGVRLTAEDVERYYRSNGVTKQKNADTLPAAKGHVVPLTPEQRGMARTVSWHRDEAAPGYVELSYDPEPWNSYAADFQKTHSLLLSPLLPLMAHRLAQLAVENPRLNSTVVEGVPGGSYLYDEVNLGFTVQAGSSLYVVVVRDAAGLSQEDFVQQLGQLQRSAMKHALTPEQTANATIAFTSMARWKVSRHIPVLPPQTALIVAHTAPMNGTVFIGATYDHRVLTGFDVVQLLQSLTIPVNI